MVQANNSTPDRAKAPTNASASGRPAPAPGTWRWKVWRIGQIRRIEGWAGLWFRLLAVAGYRRADWLVRPVALPCPSAETDLSVQIRDLTLEDEAAYLAFRRGARAEDYRQRFTEGCVCHAAWCDGRIASVTWVATGQAYSHFLNRYFPLREDELYLFDTFTHEDYRGRRLSGAMFAAMIEHYRRAGYRRMVTLIVPENRPSLRSRMRTGFRRTGTMGRVKLGPLRWDFFRGRRDEPDAMWETA